MSLRQPPSGSQSDSGSPLKTSADLPVIHNSDDLQVVHEPAKLRTLTIDELPIVTEAPTPSQPVDPSQPVAPQQPGAANAASARPATPQISPTVAPSPFLPHNRVAQPSAPVAPVAPGAHAAPGQHAHATPGQHAHATPGLQAPAAPANHSAAAHAAGAATPHPSPAPPRAHTSAPAQTSAPASTSAPAQISAPAQTSPTPPRPQAPPTAVRSAGQQTPVAPGHHVAAPGQTPAGQTPPGHTPAGQTPPPQTSGTPTSPTAAGEHVPEQNAVPARPATTSWGEAGPGGSPATTGAVGPTKKMDDQANSGRVVEEELHDSNSILRSTQTMEMRRVVGVDVDVDTMSASYAQKAPPQVGGINFTAEAGQVLGIVGPSGCGKTTLLRAMLGQIDHKGQIRYGTQLLNAAGRRDIQQTVSLVNQFDASESPLPLQRYLRFEADRRMPGKTVEERNTAVEEVMVSLQLDHKRDVAVRSLSGGQRKRVSVASALLAKSAVIYLDEPTTGLDPESEIGLLEVLGRLARHGGHTIIMITHSPAALSRCDRLVVLSPRRSGPSGVAFEGSPNEMLTHFETDRIENVYTLLARSQSDQNSPDWVKQWDQRTSESISSGEPVASPTSSQPGAAHRSWVKPVKQAWSQTRQLLAEAFADKRYLMTLIVQPLALIVVLIAVLRFDNLTVSGSSIQFLGFVAVAATLPGLLTASAQVVTERHTLRRDLTIGMSGVAYIISKFAFLAVIAFVQSLLFVTAFVNQNGGSEGALIPIRLVELWLILFAACLSVSSMGLFVSTVAQNEKSLQLYLPCLVISQIVFCGAFLIVPGVLLHAVNLVPSFWSFTGMACTHDLATMANCAAAPEGSRTPCDTTWTRTAPHQVLALGSLATQTVLYVVATLVAVRVLHRDRF